MIAELRLRSLDRNTGYSYKWPCLSRPIRWWFPVFETWVTSSLC